MSVPLVKVALSSALCQGIYLCGVVATLPDGVAILVGNDIYSDTSAAEVTVVTRSQMVQERQATKQSNTAANDAYTSLLTTNTAASSNEDDTVTDLSQLFEEAAHPSPTVIETYDRSELIRLQQSDANLTVLFEFVGKPEHPYFLRSGVLVREWKDELSPHEAAFHQVVVPTSLRATLLAVAHDIPAAGHLGVAKTKDRLIRHFYWPSLTKDVKDFCRSCDVCHPLVRSIN